MKLIREGGLLERGLFEMGLKRRIYGKALFSETFNFSHSNDLTL